MDAMNDFTQPLKYSSTQLDSIGNNFQCFLLVVLAIFDLMLDFHELCNFTLDTYKRLQVCLTYTCIVL